MPAFTLLALWACGKTWVSEYGERPRWKVLQDEAIAMAKAGRLSEAEQSFRKEQQMRDAMAAAKMNTMHW